MRQARSRPSVRSSPCLQRQIDTWNVVSGQDSIDLVSPSIDELLEPLVTRRVAAPRRHGDAEGLREKAAVELRLHGHDVEDDRLLRGEVSGHWSPGGGHVDATARH